MQKVVYYNMPQGIDYEKQLLEEWKITDLSLENKTGADLEKDLQGYDGLVTEYTILTKEILSKLPELKIIALQSIGYDEIDVKAANECGIDVTNAPGYCAEDVATHTMALFLSLIRQIPLLNQATHQGEWDCYAGKKMNRLSGKIAGIVSFGNIPQKLVPMLQGFGIRVISFDPGREAEFMQKFGVEKCDSLEELLRCSDYVFLHTPLFDSTRHMINEKTIAWMKPDAVLINTSRGGLIEESALIKALDQGKIKGASLDVIEDEKNRTSPLFKYDNVIITPHTAFLSEDSLKQSRRMALEQLVKKLVLHEELDYKVN